MAALSALLCGAACVDDPPTPDPVTGDDASTGPDAAPIPPDLTLAPTPLLSRGKPVVTSAGDGGGAAYLTDGSSFDLGLWRARPGAFVAIQIPGAPTSISVTWISSLETGPRSYRISTSADSIDGTSGTWRTLVTETDRGERGRTHVIDATGARWVRLHVDSAGPEGQIQLNELELRDVSRGSGDSWLFLGDSITAMNMHPGPTSFAAQIATARPGFAPLMLNLGQGGTHSGTALEHIDDWLAAYRDVRFVVLGYGTNDAAGDRDGAQTAAFEDRLRRLIVKITAAGKRPMLPHIPWSAAGEPTLIRYNAAIDRLRAEFQIPPGPDLFAHFKAHPEQLGDTVHPNEEGGRAMHRLWAEAMLPLYP